jgi:5-(carboxyamino)imidazole ribonucleotide mutase
LDIFKISNMKARVSIIMGSTSDLSVMEKAAEFFNDMEIPFEMNALSAHRTPDEVERFAKSAADRGIQVIIAGAGMAAHLPGVIAAMTPIPVIGVPIKASLDGMDALLAIVQMPPGIPVATVAINGALNAAILACQMMATGDKEVFDKLVSYKADLKNKIVKANKDLAEISYQYKTN